MRVSEIFHSIQGEGRWMGHPMTFVRFAGCNLRCQFCDQPEERTRSKEMTVDELIQNLATQSLPRVCITGGEPYMQNPADLERLFLALVHRGKTIHVESNGTIYNDFPVHWLTVSPKGPVDWKMYHKADELKFVVDQHFSPQNVIQNEKNAQIYLQPMNYMDSIDYDQLQRVIQMVINNPKWALSPQLHKYLNVR